MRAVAMVLTLIAFAASVGYVIALMPCQQPRALPPPRRSRRKCSGRGDRPQCFRGVKRRDKVKETENAIHPIVDS
jgi:hypothetical protein